MPEPKKPQYQITKTTFESRICCSCGGKKTKEVNIGNHQYKTVNCSTCDGTGVYEYQHIEYIDIRQALNEIGIYNMIKNTVNEILQKNENIQHS